jgi:hypothetical protein
MTLAIADVAHLASGARTSTQTGADIFNYERWDGIEVTLDLTAFTTAASIAIRLERWDPAKGAYLTVLQTANLTGNGQTTLRWGPLIPDVANSSRAGWLPERFRITIVHNNANSHTYSVSYHLFRLMGRGA